MVDDSPIFSRQYRFSPVHKEEITKQVDELLKNKIIKPSQSPYNTPVWIVPKKPDSKGNIKWRMILDFRKFNEKTIGDSYPVPNINDILDSLESARYFPVFDLATGFHYIKMDIMNLIECLWFKNRSCNIPKINGYYFNWIYRNRTLYILTTSSYLLIH